MAAHTKAKVSNMTTPVTESEDAWEEVQALKEMAQDYEETVAEEESTYDCSFKEEKARAADVEWINKHNPEEWIVAQELVERAELEAESEAEAEAERGC